MADVERASEAQARDITDRLRAAKVDAEDAAGRFWSTLIEARDAQAFLALGYSSLGAYVEAEVGMSEVHAYRLISHGEFIRELEQVTGTNPGLVDLPERETRAVRGQAREEALSQARAAAEAVPEDERPKAVAAAVGATAARQSRPRPPDVPIDVPSAPARPVQPSLWPDDLLPSIEAETDTPDAWIRDALAAALEDVSLSEYRNRRQVAALLAEGKSEREVAASTGIPRTTVQRLRGRRAPRAFEDVAPSDCKHPPGRRIGKDFCAACEQVVKR